MDVARLPHRGPSLAFRRLRALTILAVLVALVNTVLHLAHDDAADADAADAPAPTVAATTPAPPLTPEQTVADAVRRWHTTTGGQLAVEVSDLSTGTHVAYGSTSHAFATASVVKVDILAALLLQKKGRLSASQRRTAAAMIQQSSNGAATSLWKAIGKEKGLDAANDRLGLTQTKGGTRGRWGATTTTTTDQLRLLQVVLTDNSPLDAGSRRYVASLMGHVAVDQDWGVPAAATGGKRSYVKDGWLPRAGGWAVTSIGSVERDGHTLLVAALSDRGRSQRDGIAAVEQVATSAAQVVTRT